MSCLPYLPCNIDPYDDMDWFPEIQCYDACPAYSTLNCCTTTDLCGQIGIDQEPRIGKDGFQVWLDVSNFKRDEITVGIENNLIVVHAKEEAQIGGRGYISREFARRYELPEEFKAEDVIAILSCDGILQIKVNKIKLLSFNFFTIFNFSYFCK